MVINGFILPFIALSLLMCHYKTLVFLSPAISKVCKVKFIQPNNPDLVNLGSVYCQHLPAVIFCNLAVVAGSRMWRSIIIISGKHHQLAAGILNVIITIASLHPITIAKIIIITGLLITHGQASMMREKNIHLIGSIFLLYLTDSVQPSQISYSCNVQSMNILLKYLPHYML